MNMTHEERVRRLRGMLNQVAGDGGIESVEVPAPPGGLESMSDLGSADSNLGVQSALDKLKSGMPISPVEADALEAIILPDKRPVVFIRNNLYGTVPMADWAHLNTPDVQSRLNPLLTSIGRIELPLQSNIPYGGTGFVVGPNLMMTNRHVARLFVDGLGTRLVYRTGGSAIDFKREEGSPSGGALLDVIDVVMVHPFWDMALLKVSGLPAEAKSLVVSVSAPEDLIDEDVIVVGYPAQDFRNDITVQNQVFEGKFGVKRLAPGKVRPRSRIVSFENTVDAMTHDSSTLGGNSGSAVISVKTGKVVALHFAGEYLKANYCVPTYELARDTRVVDTGINFEKSIAPTSAWASAWKFADGTAEVTGNGKPATPLASNPVATTAPVAGGLSPDSTSGAASAAGAKATINLLLPLQISVTVGTAKMDSGTAQFTSVTAAPAVEAEVEKVPVIFPDLSSRSGYDPTFLELDDAVTVPLPTLTAPGLLAAARLDDGTSELKYHRFSIVINKRRRLALFTAANVDWRDEQRKVNGKKPTRKALNGFTGSEGEDWVIDPRIPLDSQLPDFFFTKDGGAFDRGHLVRRDDVTWGDSFDAMQKGNGDTFHTTNCSPQTAEFNRPAEQNWGALEQMIQDETNTEKVCVFSGPVLDDEDEFFHGFIKSNAPVSVQIPRKFWKIIVANVDGQPAAFGFILDQDLSQVDLHAELAIPDAWKEHMRSVEEIEEQLQGLARLTAFKDWDQIDNI